MVLPAVRFSSGFNAGIGAWLIIAPFILSYSGIESAMWNDIVVGAWLLIVAGLRAVNTTKYEGLSWANVFFGLWLVAAPFVLGYASFGGGLAGVYETGAVGDVTALNHSGATWNDIVNGVLVIILAARSASATRGWKSVVTAGNARTVDVRTDRNTDHRI